MEVLSLKDKLLKSRTLWSSMNQANFLIDLYETLDVIELLQNWV